MTVNKHSFWQHSTVLIIYHTRT